MISSHAVAAALTVVLAAAAAGQDERAIRVVATLPVLADLAREVGGDRVEARALARPAEDPHYVKATPSLMAAVNRADLFVELGLSLELWAENALDGGRNPRIRRGALGHVVAARGVRPLGVPENPSRADGDVHPDGNPHVWFDPIQARRMASNITAGLQRVDPDRAAQYLARLEDFERRIDRALFGERLVEMIGGNTLVRLARGDRLAAFLDDKSYRGKPLRSYLGGWLGQAEALRDRKIVFYHDSWPYFSARFGLDVVDHVESKPGITPTAGRRAEIVERMRREGVGVIGMLEYYDDTIAHKLARDTGARVVVLPAYLPNDAPGAYFRLIDRLIGDLRTAFAAQ